MSKDHTMGIRMKPKIIATFVPTGGRRIVELALEILNKPGSIAKISSLLAKHNVNILWGFHAAAPEDKVEIWGLFVEVPKGLDLNSLISKIKSLDVVFSIRYSEKGYGQFLVDSLYYPILTTMGDQVALLSWNECSELFKYIKEKYGVDTLREIGRRLVKRFAKNMCKTLKGMKLSEKEMISYIADALTVKGYGKFEIKEIREAEGIVVISATENIECSALKELKEGVWEGLIIGMLEELAAEVFGKKVKVEEIVRKCARQPYCEYIIKYK